MRNTLLFVSAVLVSGTGLRAAEPPLTLQLHDSWRLESSAKTEADGTKVSSLDFDAKGWYETTVPTTVFAALVANKVYPDPLFGEVLHTLPGASYPPGENFSLLQMPTDSPFRAGWWFRKEFELNSPEGVEAFFLKCDGINYRANIFMNGKLVARSEDVAGAFRRYFLDVTSVVRPHGRNTLAIEVFAPKPDELGITFVDWNPLPPDKDMGLWQGVSLVGTGPVVIRNPFVSPKLDLPGLETAHLTVSADVKNASAKPLVATVRGSIGEIAFEQAVSLGAGETKTVVFAPDRFKELDIPHPRIWWPYRMGSPELYELSLRALVDGRTSDASKSRFGVREVSSELIDGHRLFKVNGRKILIRGGGWSPDMMLRFSLDRLDADFRYVKDMGLNTIRLEGKLEPEPFFSKADEEGVLVMAGWCCCDHWEKWKKWDAATRDVAVKSLEDQVLRLRTHPSVFVWLNGSDNPPPADVESAYLSVLDRCRWLNPVLSSATEKVAASGPSGVKMTGPYDYVPPSYWLLDTERGGAHGLNMETSPGAAVPPVESLKVMLPPDHLWPIDDFWSFHAGGGVFRQLKLFTSALEGRYGKSRDVEDYARKSQALAYEGERAMFEAFARNKYKATGVIQWMLNNAWPSMIWHLYDFYLRPGGGYFGAKKALEPLHVQYSYDDRSVVVVNDLQEAFEGLKVSAKVYDIDLKERFSGEASLSVAADGVVRALTLPDPGSLTPTYFVALALEDGQTRTVSRNFYWLSTRADDMDWKKSDWYYTPVRVHADLTALGALPPARLSLESHSEDRGELGTATVKVRNESDHLAFQIRLRLKDGEQGEEILPVFWEDNYLALLPGETREIHVSYRQKDRKGSAPAVSAEGWNVPLTKASTF